MRASRLPSPSGRTRMRSQRPASPLWRADPHLLLAAAAFARRLEQAIDRFRDAGIADEDALDRAHVAGDPWPRPAPDRRCWHRARGRSASVTRMPSLAPSTTALSSGLAASRLDVRSMPAASANSRNTPTMASTASSGEDVGLGLGPADEQQGRRRRPPARARSAARGRCCRRRGSPGSGRSGRGLVVEQLLLRHDRLGIGLRPALHLSALPARVRRKGFAQGASDALSR